MKQLAWLLGVIAGLALPRTGTAQRPDLPRPFETRRIALTLPGEEEMSLHQVTIDSLAIRPTHWVLGGVVGAVVVGTAGTLWALDLCADKPNVGCGLLGAGLGGAIGFTSGALIGGQFPKSP